MDEFVEGYCMLVGGSIIVVAVRTLRLLQRFDILYVLGWQTLDEFIHFELVFHTRLLALTTSWYKIAPIGVEQTSEASHKRRAYLVGSKGCGTDDADCIDASTVGVCATSYTILEKNVAPRGFETHRCNGITRHQTFLRILSI
jgi:hypothetical protein